MVKIICIVILYSSLNTYADFLGFGGEEGTPSQLPTLIQNLKKLDMKADPAYEENFNKGVKAIETRVEEEKLYCSGEVADAQGKILPSNKKQLCIRELKKYYVEAMDVIHGLKKKYLGLIHSKQIERLEEVHKKLKADIEKNF